MWIGEAGAALDLDPPNGLGVTRGEVMVQVHEACGNWAYYETDVTLDGANATIEVGMTEQIGGAAVTVGTHERQLDL